MNIQQYWSTVLTLLTAHFGVYVTRQLNRCSTWNRKKTALFSGHYLRNRSTLDIGVLVISVHFNIRNTLPKSGTFLLGHLYTCRYCFECLLGAQIKFAFNSADSTEIRPAGVGGGSMPHWVIAVCFRLPFQTSLTYFKAFLIAHRSGKVWTRVSACWRWENVDCK